LPAEIPPFPASLADAPWAAVWPRVAAGVEWGSSPPSSTTSPTRANPGERSRPTSPRVPEASFPCFTLSPPSRANTRMREGVGE
jgi:hypothetical protein